MTLILSCVLDDCAYQISDRRLTSLEIPRGLIDDDTNKAMVLGGRVAFGYTGIARIRGEQTDKWLTRIAAQQPSPDLGTVVRHIAETATTDFARMRLATRYKRHAFQGVGWFRTPRGLLPGVVTIENAYDETGKWLGFARPEFNTSFRTYTPGRAEVFIDHVGHTLNAHQIEQVVRLLRRCAHRRTRRHEAILEALVMAMQWLHSITGGPVSTIGPSFMLVSIPALAVEANARTGGAGMWIGPPDLHGVMSFDINPQGRTYRTMPHFVFQGTAFTDGTFHPID